MKKPLIVNLQSGETLAISAEKVEALAEQMGISYQYARGYFRRLMEASKQKDSGNEKSA
ncbi:MAG: hypothetical protein FWD25_00765 [Clostridia bacterium]|nr:hypothetical protein [Clostridia bacterium]